MSDFDIRSIPFGDSTTADDVVDTLGFFDDWEDRYKYIIDLGKELPPMPDEMHTESRIVRGCQSQVWLEIDYDADADCMYLAVDSDALIVRGLGAMVLAALNRKSPRAVMDFDMEGYFDKLDLLKHLSPTRGNGVRAMVERIRKEAAALA
ncbi:MAG: SufE family protein [Alcanivoracaceae bacterium]|jgi:cysteine desulfuration protein SufE|nr:SufE family protein [Alcanivoracaceae bacterium]